MHNNTLDNNKPRSISVIYGPHDFSDYPENYLRLTDDLDKSARLKAHETIKKVLINAFSNKDWISKFSELPNKSEQELTSVSLNFINYGNTELVYKATFSNKVEVAVSINQPHTPLGVVKQEFENLENLAKLNHRFIVTPKSYFSMANSGHELYVSEYFSDAMCVIHNPSQGVLDPMPHYHFENFTREMSHVINSTMIALFVYYYDEKLNRGISKTQINGNDFMLTRHFNKDDIYTVPHSLKLMAARDFVEISLEKYCNILKREFTRGTLRTDDDVLSGKLIINHNSVKPMTPNDISVGIEWGLDLRKNRS